MACFNRFIYHYKRLLFSYFDKSKIEGVDTSIFNMSLNPDSSHFELRKLKYGNKDSIMTVNILKKQLLDSIGKQCTYLFELADVNIYLTNSEHMDVMPLPWGIW